MDGGGSFMNGSSVFVERSGAVLARSVATVVPRTRLCVVPVDVRGCEDR
jgi:hypothetical protein